MYTVYSLPNVAIPLAGGWLTDRFGVRPLLGLFSTLVLAGQLLVTAGLLRREMALVLVGRTVFGLGGESLSVVQNVLTCSWFRGSQLSLALGLLLVTGKLGSITNSFLSPVVAERYGTGWAIWTGALFCAGGWLVALLLVAADRRWGGKGQERRKKKEKTEQHLQPPPPSATNTVRLRDLRRLGAPVWLLMGVMVAAYSIMVPFHIVASDLLQTRYRVSAVAAGRMMSIPDLVGLPAIPLIGWLTDRCGRRGHWLVAGMLAFALCMSTMAATSAVPPYAILVVSGAGNAILSAVIWPAIGLMTDPSLHGTVFGLATAILNASLALVPVIVAAIIAHTAHGFTNVLAMLSAFAGLGAALAAMLTRLDALGSRALSQKTQA